MHVYRCLWACMFSSLFVCLCVCSRPVRSFVAEAINSPQPSAPVVLSFADRLGPSLVYVPTLHVAEKYWHCQRSSALLNVSSAFTYQVSNAKGWIHQRVHTLLIVAIVLPSDTDWEKRHLRGREQSGQQDAGADPAILMHMLHRNIDQLFSLWLPQDWVIVCLCFYCLNQLHFGSVPPQINDRNNDGGQWCWSEEVASQINTFSFNIILKINTILLLKHL